MFRQNLFEQFDAIFDLHVFFYHDVEDEVHDAKQSAQLFIRILMLNTVIEINVVEIQNKLIDFVDFVTRIFLYGI